MKKWILGPAILLLGALAFAACGDDSGDANTEAAAGDGSLPQVSDDARVPGVGAFRVTVSFNEDAVQGDLDAISVLLAGYDESAEYVIQESFPPTGVATLTTDAEDFCETAVSLLEAEAFVTAASCGPQLEPGDVDHDDPGPDGSVTSAVCAPDTPDCEDMIVETCDGDACTGDNDGSVPPVDALPPAPDDARPPVAGEYRVTIRFNTTVEQADTDEVGARIRDFDPDAEYVIQESWPPTGVANFVSETEDACLALAQGLEQETFVTSVSCGPQLEPGDIDPDEPVVDDLR